MYTSLWGFLPSRCNITTSTWHCNWSKLISILLMSADPEDFYSRNSEAGRFIEYRIFAPIRCPGQMAHSPNLGCPAVLDCRTVKVSVIVSVYPKPKYRRITSATSCNTRITRMLDFGWPTFARRWFGRYEEENRMASHGETELKNSSQVRDCSPAWRALARNSTKTEGRNLVVVAI